MLVLKLLVVFSYIVALEQIIWFARWKNQIQPTDLLVIEQNVLASDFWKRLGSGKYTLFVLLFLVAPLVVPAILLYYLMKLVVFPGVPLIVKSILLCILAVAKSIGAFFRAFVPQRKRRSWDDTLELAEHTIKELDTFLKEKFGATT
jgi:hypothetical protein